MDESTFPRVAAGTRSKGVWEIMETGYRDTAKVKVAKSHSIRRNFENLQINESACRPIYESIHEYCKSN